MLKNFFKGLCVERCSRHKKSAMTDKINEGKL